MRTGSISDAVEDAQDEDNETVAPTCMSEWTGPMQCVVAACSVRAICSAAHR
jgi:hypothetical protein